MRRHFLAYATANESWRFSWDAVNFRHLARFDPGVERVEIVIAISQAREIVDRLALAELCRIAERNPRLAVRAVLFKPNPGRDFSSWRRALARMAAEAQPDDYVLCLNRSAYGPLGDGWFSRFVEQLERSPGAVLCGNSINFEGYGKRPAPEHTHVQTYAFLGTLGVLERHLARLSGLQARTREEAIVHGELELGRNVLAEGSGITSLAWPRHVFTAAAPYDAALPQRNISFELTETPFRHWRRRDYWRARNPLGRLAWAWRVRRPRRDAWAQWAACLDDLYGMSLEEHTPRCALMAGEAPARPAQPADLTPRAPRIGVHLHLFYPDLWDEISAYLAHLPAGFGLHVTTHKHDEPLFAAIAQRFPGASISVTPNRGLDIGPFLSLLGAGTFDRYAYVCKIHSKKTPDPGGGESYFGRAWRRRLLHELLGSPAQVAKILSLFDADERVGIVGAAGFRLPNERVPAERALGRNQEGVSALLARCGEDRAAALDFFAGSMFWFRPPALGKVRALGIGPDDFPDKAYVKDGTLAHALERVIPTVAGLSGYRLESAPTT
jgi:hypothetical protein